MDTVHTVIHIVTWITSQVFSMTLVLHNYTAFSVYWVKNNQAGHMRLVGSTGKNDSENKGNDCCHISIYSLF